MKLYNLAILGAATLVAGFFFGCAPETPVVVAAVPIVAPTAVVSLNPPPPERPTPTPATPTVREETRVDEAPKVLVVRPSELINRVSSELDSATTEAQCIEISDALYQIKSLSNAYFYRLQDRGAFQATQPYRYLNVVVGALIEANETKRKGLIQVNPEMGRMYLRSVGAYIKAARQTLGLCSESYTFELR